MKRYLAAYAGWLAFVFIAGGIAVAWYRHVEQIGLMELVERMNDTDAGNGSNTGNGTE